MNTEITCFYKLLSYALHSDHSDMITQTQKEQIRQKLPDLFQLAKQHNVSLFVYDALCQCDIDDPLLQETTFQREMLFECYHNYDMLFFAKKILALLEEHSVSYCLLKGVSLLANYPKPECRNASDIDILVSDPKEYMRTRDLLLSYGFCVANGTTDHHEELLYYENDKTYLLELHNKLINNSGNVRDETIKALFKQTIPVKKKLSFAALSYQCLNAEQNLLYLLLHMLQHFTSLGFGAKLLCDWTVFLEHHAHEIDFMAFQTMLEDLGLVPFCEVMTELCIRYLGLPREILEKNHCTFLAASIDPALLQRVLDDIHTAGEFGKENHTRVLIAHQNNFSSTIAQGHRQMKIYFPKLSHCFLFWPVLWSITLYRFLCNNRRLRKINTKTILENTRQRQELFKALSLDSDAKRKEN